MRPVDAVLIGWFCVGLAVTFFVDIEAVEDGVELLA